MQSGWLRIVMLADAFVLGMFGLGLVLAPRGMFQLFNLSGLPPAVNYIAGMWGALLLTMALAYLLGSAQPRRNLVLVQIGIARAVIELGVSAWYVLAQTLSFKQAAAGAFLALWFAIAYLALYPRNAVPATVAGKE